MTDDSGFYGTELTLAQLKQALEDRAKLGDGDTESGHGDEDWIHESIVKQLALGNPDAQEMARLAVAFFEDPAHHYNRWYA